MIGLFKPISRVFQRFTSPDEAFFQEIEAILLQSDLGVRATSRIIEELRGAAKKERVKTADDLLALLKAGLTETLKSHAADRRPHVLPAVELIVGVNGTGKTTTIAKLAHRAQVEGESVILAAADTYRAAAIEQLGVWSERLGADLVKHERGADAAAVVFDAIAAAQARGAEVVLVDTAGRLHTQVNLMEELKKLKRVAEAQAGPEAVRTLLIIDATTGQNGLVQARVFHEALQVDGIILTKLDGTAKGGIAVAIEEELDLPILMVGTGEHLEDLEPFDPVRFVEALVSKG